MKDGREELLKEKIMDEPPTDEQIKSFKTLISYYSQIHGFMAGHLSKAAEILSEGRKESELRFLSFTGNLVSTGLRGLFAKLIRDGHFNVVVTTAGTLDHDIAKALGPGYFKGGFEYDDSMLYEYNIHRLGNVFVPFESYGEVVEKAVKEFMEEKKGKTLAVYEALWSIGEKIEDKNSILRAAYERKVPIIVPGMYDGSFGTNALIYGRIYNVKLDLSLDEKLLEDMTFESQDKKSLALIIGGGISKHHVIWWNQFKNGLDYAIYLTTAVEYDGSLSGAQTREAISWGKLKSKSKHIVVYGDATITLPILASALY
ncbi:deoxyhypusine synthase [Fervidicoccus fontis]|uniref:Probable deoxyhypusine synthase n=2 Tax=Fervidicoccus fontis TaxID=683846 RepID=I0A184_FERFK|nr:deoxyhypusine synthase [Fervidicoccus fontis]AFH42741.1 putative deoxyhypusine synthase [Fervidicoccus fontis Kam940]MBE9391337.1 deoxyhypusine synthase [Fervidicoccus fontis]PMB75424.1 MAG: deoxyhypusine synthase [Fervidicoccus fontis]PMB76700.1 MAG: deoxyhypusine synthase [Fervidicoccus fontis]HEW63796.1 deoxyhypusine synthase [Fervidicoccus fontis]